MVPCRPALLLLLVPAVLTAQAPESILAPPDSQHWTLEGRAAVSEYLGRTCLMLDGGLATLNRVEFRDGVIDVDVATPAKRGFFGIQFRIDSVNGEWVYLRQHKTGLPDAIQYTPVLNTGLNWQIYNGPGFTAPVDIPRETWFHLRLSVAGATARFYVGDTIAPALVMDDLKSGIERGGVSLAVLTGATCFANVVIHPTTPVPWVRHPPPMPASTLTRWEISPSFDALARNLERPLSPSEAATIPWQPVEAEPPGFVVLNRYRDSPHPRVTFQSDFSKRLDPQPGTRVVYARTTIRSDRASLRKLELGYSDEVSVFLNGQILYRGRSAQAFRDPGFLGIVYPEDDAVYLPLKRGENQLVLAVSELGGGWGFISRLTDPAN